MAESLVPAGKEKGAVAAVGEELPENAPRRGELVGLLCAAPALGVWAVLAAGPSSGPGAVAHVVVSVFPTAMVFVAGYFATFWSDLVLSGLDGLLWPAFRALGERLASSFQDGRRVSPFLRGADPIVESRAIQTFIPDDQWIPSVGGTVAVHLVFFASALLFVAAQPAMLAAIGLGILGLWTAVLARVLLLALRTAAGRYRLLIGGVWMAQEALAWFGRLGRRGYYLTQPELQLEPGAAADVVVCPYCAAELGDAPRVACERCHTPHHADCWEAFGRCTVYACTGEVGRKMG